MVSKSQKTTISGINEVQIFILAFQACICAAIIAIFHKDIVAAPFAAKPLLGLIAAITVMIAMLNHKKFSMTLLMFTAALFIISIFIIADIHP